MLGQAPPATNDLISDPQLRIVVTVLFTIVGLGIIAAAWLKRRFQSAEPDVDANDLLSDFRKLREQGIMSEEEFKRVKLSLGNKIREDSGVSPVERGELAPLAESALQESDDEYEWNEVDLPPESGESHPNAGDPPKPPE